MSAIGQILDQVEALVKKLLGEREAKQDARLDAVEKRLDALESTTGASAARKATAAKTTPAKASPSK